MASVSEVPGFITPVVVVWRPELRESVVTTVGQNEYALSRLRSSHKGSGIEIVDGVPATVVEVLHEPLVFVGVGDEAGNVLDEEGVGADGFCELEGLGPEISFVF